MKQLICLITTVLLLGWLTSCSSVRATPENAQAVAYKVEQKDYTITADHAIPARGKRIYLSGNYDLQVRGDSAIVYLPFFGRAYSATFGEDGGIKFADKLYDYKAEPTKKGDGWNISFKVDTKNDNYSVMLLLFNNGNASFSVSSVNKEAISYTGQLKP